MEINIDKDPVMSASEVRDFVFCPVSFLLKRTGIKNEDENISEGTIGTQLELISIGKTYQKEIAEKVDIIKKEEKKAERYSRSAILFLVITFFTLVLIYLLNPIIIYTIIQGIIAIAVWILAVIFYANMIRYRPRLLRNSIGLPPKGEIKYVDGIRIIKPRVIYSKKYNLKGKPDMITMQDNKFIPLQNKPKSEKAYDNHIMQLMAYCLLVEESYKIRPDYGILVLKDGKREKIKFTDEKREELINVLEKMREMTIKSEMPSHFVGQKKCSSCGYEKVCKGLITQV